MPRVSRPCVECGGGDDEGLILLCEGCDVPVHAHCEGFNGPLGNGWLCRVCKDQAAVSDDHESEDNYIEARRHVQLFIVDLD